MARPGSGDPGGGEPVRAELPNRFLVAVDAAATAAGLEGTDDYLAEWVRTSRTCGPDLEAEVDEEVERLLAAHPREVLQAMVANDGRRPTATPDREPDPEPDDVDARTSPSPEPGSPTPPDATPDSDPAGSP